MMKTDRTDIERRSRCVALLPKCAKLAATPQVAPSTVRLACRYAPAPSACHRSSSARFSRRMMMPRAINAAIGHRIDSGYKPRHIVMQSRCVKRRSERRR